MDELLPADDCAFLGAKFKEVRVYEVGSEVHVLFPSFQFPSGYIPQTADMLLRLPAGYPDAKPDMFWTKPDVKLASGAWPAASELHEVPGSGSGVEVYNNIPWQRWSRHHAANSDWRPGKDGLQSFVATIKNELNRKI